MERGQIPSAQSHIRVPSLLTDSIGKVAAWASYQSKPFTLRPRRHERSNNVAHPSAAASPAIALWLQSTPPVGRIDELGSLGRCERTYSMSPIMNEREFDIIETRHFLTLTERGSKRSFRIPVSDSILVGGLAAPKWRGGDVVKLSEKQQSTLAEIDARWRERGDDAAVGQNRLSNKLGCLSWIAVLAVLAVVAVVVWWIIKSRH